MAIKDSWDKLENNSRKDYSNILTKKDLMDIDQQTLDYLRTEAKTYVDNVKRKTSWSPTRTKEDKNKCFSNAGFAGIIKNPQNIEHKRRKLNESKVELTLIKANVACFSKETLFNLLLDKNISYNTLAIISRDIDELKTLSQLINKLNMLLKNNVDDENLKLLRLLIKKLDKKTESLSKKLDAICKIFEKYYSLSDIDVIVARLLQITVFERELYKNIEKQKVH